MSRIDFLVPVSENSILSIFSLCLSLRKKRWVGVSVAAGSYLMATWLNWFFPDLLGRTVFLTYYPACVVSTLIGGWPVGLAFFIACGATAWTLLLPSDAYLGELFYILDAGACVMIAHIVVVTFGRLGIELEKQAVLTAELEHRNQNLLSVMQSVVGLSLKGPELISKEEAKQRILSRLFAIAETNRIFNANGQSILLSNIILRETQSHKDRVELKSNSLIFLGDQLARDFSLIIHELTINSIKYGALSTPTGRVVMSWSADQFSWQELDGPSPISPQQRGFGSVILESLPRVFCQNVAMRFAETGFSYSLSGMKLRAEQPAPSEIRSPRPEQAFRKSRGFRQKPVSLHP